MLNHSSQQPSSFAAKLADVLDDGGWRTKARPPQLPPTGRPWNGWVCCAGRGFGKTFVGANYTNELANTVSRMVLIGATASDLRDTMIEGDSGILRTAPDYFRPNYEPSKRRLEWPNGSTAVCLSAEEPDRLRGINTEWAWLDEFASYGKTQQETWDMMSFGLRLGKNPRWLITTTPRPSKLLKSIMARDDVVVSTGSTFDNEANLAPPFIEAIKRRYEGTRLGRQEMYAELLSDTPGALWQQDWIDRDRVQQLPWEGLQRVVVAIDPAVTSGEDSDETGIIVAGKDAAGHGYVLEDCSGRYQPHEWSGIAIDAYKRHGADRIIGERNNGGDMIEATIRSIDPNVSFKSIHASRGKVTRAEPVSALYEKGMVHHLGTFTKLEDQFCSFTSDFSKATAGYSPDRADSAVYAISELMLGQAATKLYFA
jgi:predicted phage terminase large subunit-like protein